MSNPISRLRLGAISFLEGRKHGAEIGLTSKWSRRARYPVRSCRRGVRLIWRVRPNDDSGNSAYSRTATMRSPEPVARRSSSRRSSRIRSPISSLELRRSPSRLSDSSPRLSSALRCGRCPSDVLAGPLFNRYEVSCSAPCSTCSDGPSSESDGLAHHVAVLVSFGILEPSGLAAPSRVIYTVLPLCFT